MQLRRFGRPPAEGSLGAERFIEEVRLLNLRLEMLLWKMEEALAAPALIAALTSSLNSCITIAFPC